MRAGTHLEPWGEDDLALLEKCLADPAMMEHLGGPESPEKIAECQLRYQQPDSRQFKIVVGRRAKAPAASVLVGAGEARASRSTRSVGP